MKCYYEVLEVDKDADDDEIKKSYKKLALKWHPDKNLDDADGAKMKFQTIQQAYEVLSDPRERSWYDNHRDSILKGGFDSDYKDDSLDVYRYFTSNCYSGYGDDPKSFYSVYAEVFKTIAAEDSAFDDDNSDTDVDVPQFGDSTSSYDDVVGPFYAHWESYSTKKTFSWLDQFDIRQAPDRRVVKMMERENKKIRDAARKQRNDEVRNLVAFVRKRDKRIQIRIRQLELKAEENELKNRRQRNEQILRRKAEIDSTVESEWSKFSNFEDKLKEIEADVDSKFDDGAEENDPLYCVACDKLFKTVKTFTNHESSKKHKENLLLIAESMLNDDEAANDETLDLSGLSLEDDPIVESTFKKKNKKDKKRINKKTKVDELVDDENVDLSGLSLEDDPIVESTVKKKNKKEKKRLKKGDASTIDHVTNDLSAHSPDDDTELESTVLKTNKKYQKRTTKDELTTDEDLSAHSPDDESWVKKKNKKEKKRTKTVDNVDETTTHEDDIVDAPRRRRRRKEITKDDKPPVEVENDEVKTVAEIKCSSCEETFKSKNALFKHLRSTGHAAILTTNYDRVPKKKNKWDKR